MLGEYDKPSTSIVLGNCDYVTNKTSMGLGFSFLEWWFLSLSVTAWAKEMSLEVYEEFLTTLSSASSKKAKLPSNYRSLSKLEPREDCGTFLHFVF